MTPETMNSPAGRDDQLFLLIDGHAIVFRAWFAVRDHLITSSGQNTTGASGFMAMFLKVLREQNPTHVAVTFDTRAQTFREEMFPAYKAQREEVDPALHEQIPIVKEILEPMGVPVFEYDGFEADDLIGTLSKQATEQGIKTLILTGDADQLQLVDEKTSLMMYTGFGEVRIYDPAAVAERYDGLGPEYVAEIKALEGDPSDNIPGVPGVGKKAARAVLTELGHFDSLFSRLDEVQNIKGLRGAKRAMNLLEEHRETAATALVLTTIVRDVPVEFDSEASKFGDFDREAVLKALLNYELRAVANRLPKTSSIAATGAATGAVNSSAVTDSGQIDMLDENEAPLEPEPPKPLGEYEIVTDMAGLKSMVAELSAKGEFAFDTETTGLNSMTSDLVGLSFAVRSEHAWYVAVGHTGGEQVPYAEALAALRPLFEDESIKKTAHNANFDMMVLASAGIEVKNLAFDTMIAAQLCGRRALGLKALALELFHAEMTEIKTLIGVGRKQIPMSEVPIETAGPYAAADADFTWRLKEYFEPEIDRHNARYVYEEIELPLLPVIIEMQRNGMMIDKSALAEMSEQLGADIELIQQTATAVIGGRELNLASNRQVADLLIDELGAPKTRKTKTGYSMDANALEKIRETSGLDDRVYQIADAVLKYRELTKLKSTYVDALPELVNPATGRVHTSFNQVGSATGRLSSTDPNVQNIPVRTELGRKVRKAFVADAKNGWQFLAADYSQIELRILAHMSQEPGLLEAFRNGEDIHDATARAMYGIEDVTPDQRRIAKILNFGVIYGLGPVGVARQTDLTRQQGQEFIDLYFGKYPGIKDFIEEVKQFAHTNGFAQTITGRRRYLPDINAAHPGHRAAAERVSVNMPVQGTAADVIKIAMINISNEMKALKMRSKMSIQVHDELIFEIAPGELMEMQAMVTTMMPAAMDLTVPLLVEAKTGPTWGDME
ncbi:MAG: DNA polymerase I [Chloroflexi bacterium]|nr:DNA polymerase I [Chloroflexota bacterium]MCI0837454.1 DNA polymerase I [Chloroflexota bacterium]MCI0852335.1 DNA polymerase I [Chloroflexota bacterium]MCI0872138.1 DNA polymerase I [Chloroflexota bacterium]